MISPKLTLVGAGPGDPELITLKGVKALQLAGAVLYDALAPVALLDHAPSSSPKIFVGKRKDDHEMSQQEINQLIGELAFKHGNVVRLKGGDPFVFGRGIEELEAMARLGIPTEYIPGISSAVAVPGLAGIPVTARGISDSFWVVSGATVTGKPSENIRIAARSNATVVILMGQSSLPGIVDIFIEEGQGQRPAAIIQDGSLPTQKIAASSISGLVAEATANNIGAPAVIVIGDVAGCPWIEQRLASPSMERADYEIILGERLDDLKRQGSYRYFLDVNKSAQHFPKFYFEDFDGRKKQAVNWCSNDYLCMSINEEVISRLSFVAHRSGAGSGGTRNISGTTIYHRELEENLASLHGKESALVFGGAYLANVTALGTLGKQLPGCTFISDAANHASIIEGIRSSGCTKRVFRHNDIDHLEEILKQLPASAPRIIVVESIYSVTGSIAPLGELITIAKKYACLTYVDEVHAVGLYGSAGAGIAEMVGLSESIDIINGTLAKGFGVIGGYIAASKKIVDVVRSFGKGFIFTTSLPPAICAAATKSIAWLKENPATRSLFHEKVKLFRKILTEHRVPFIPNHSHITTVPIGDAARCKAIADELLHQLGIYIQPINSPTVPKGEECLRMTVTLRHEEQDMQHLALNLEKVLRAHSGADTNLHENSSNVRSAKVL